MLVATARPAFWRDQIQGRIRGDVVVNEVALQGYTDAELRELLTRVGVAPATLPWALQQFLRTPRVATVALRLLNRVVLDPSELTRERLLLEYWRERAEERGSLLVHSSHEFARLLISHADAWRKRQHPFPLDNWVAHSGPAQRDGIERARGDLTEIAEGRFLVPVEGRPDQYTFRPEVLPFALGTLIVGELRETMEMHPDWADDALQESVEGAIAPVRGFDAIGEVVVAAVGLACLDAAYPMRGRRALVRTWLDLQNSGPNTAHLLASYVPVAPSLFLDLIEGGPAGDIYLSDQHTLLRLVLAMRQHPAVEAAVVARVPRWLTQWSVAGERRDNPDRATERQAEREARCADTLSQFTATERAAFHRLTLQVSHAGAYLSRAAAMLLANRPLAAFAPALAGWALAQVVAGEVISAADDLHWVALLNTHDPEALAAAVTQVIRELMPDDDAASLPMRSAAAMTLRLSGDIAHAAWAERLDGVQRGQRWQRAENVDEADPYDPAASRGTRVDATSTMVEGLSKADLWASHQLTSDDFTFEHALPTLARFEPQVIVRTIREVLQSAPDRSEGALRSLALQLQWLAPLVDRPTAEALLLAFERLVAGDTGAEQAGRSSRDLSVAAHFASVAMQYLEPAEQVALLTNLPADTPLLIALRNFLKPVPSDLLEYYLRDGTPDAQRWALFAAGAQRLEITDALRAHLGAMLQEESRERVAMAALAIQAGADPVLDAALLERAAQPENPFATYPDDDRLTNALAAAVHRHTTPQTVGLLPVDMLPVATHFGPEGVAAFDAAILQLMARYAPNARDTEDVIVFGGPRRTPDDAERHLLGFPPADALSEFSRRHLDVSRAWCRAACEQASPSLWMRIATFTVTLASAVAPHDGALAAAVLQRGLAERYFARVTIDGVDVLHRSCFADAVDLHALQESLLMQCMTDAELEDMLRAAEAAGATGRLDRLAQTWLNSGRPALVARALTMVGLRATTAEQADVLTVDYGVGTLGSVARWAQREAERHQWMTTWLQRAAESRSHIDVWRFGTLATGLADSRVRTTWAALASRSEVFDTFAGEIRDRALAQAKRRAEKRKKTLFGLPAPADDLRRALEA